MIFITGASGCVGSYLVEYLVTQTNEQISLLVRTPENLKQAYYKASQVTLLSGDLEHIEDVRKHVQAASHIIHIATSWGGPSAYSANLKATERLFAMSHSKQSIFYFSTASLLKQNHQFETQTLFKGSDYIRSKASAYLVTQSKPPPAQLIYFFPTVILGGDSEHKETPFQASFSHWPHWLKILKFISIKGYFQWIHAADIAQVLAFYLKTPPSASHIVLGQAPEYVPKLLKQINQTIGKAPPFQIPIDSSTERLMGLLSPWMGPWDRFSFKQRFMQHKAITPEHLGLISKHPQFCDYFLNHIQTV